MELDLTGLNDTRAKLYKRLADAIGPNPLHKIDALPVRNECEIYVQCEHLNPTGSIYDRMTLALLAGFETGRQPKRGRISPGDKLAETTTGSSGASFAWLCRVLGYSALVFIPADMPTARIGQIRSYDADVHLTPPREYIDGLVKAFEPWAKSREGREYRKPNHSRDVTFAPAAMSQLANEVEAELMTRYGHRSFDFFMAAMGNGASARGVYEGLSSGTRMIGVSPKEWPHQVFGTGAGTEKVWFPNLDIARSYMDRTLEIADGEWRPVLEALHDEEFLHVGNSTAMSVAAALRVAGNSPSRSRFLVLGYDAAWRYLDLEDAEVAKARDIDTNPYLADDNTDTSPSSTSAHIGDAKYGAKLGRSGPTARRIGPGPRSAAV